MYSHFWWYNTANAKRIGKTILIGIGKGLYYFGKGLWFLLVQLYHGIRWTAIKIHEHDRRVAYEEGIRDDGIREQREHDAQIYHDNWIAEKARIDAQAELEARRQNEQNQRDTMENLTSLMWGENPRKRKKKSDY